MTFVVRNKYQLPIPIEKPISKDTHSSPAHSGKLENAIDFVAPGNTIVLAADEDSHVR
jgi:pyruvate/2-oxoglutarate/acetoin dehydrogenase E1 component